MHRRTPMRNRVTPTGEITAIELRGAWLGVLDTVVVPWTTGGYQRPRPRPRAGAVEAITPPSTLAALRAGYLPQIDQAADR